MATNTPKPHTVVLTVPTRKLAQPSPTRKRLAFDHSSDDEHFTEPTTPQRKKPFSSKILEFEDLSSVDVHSKNQLHY